MVGLVCKICVSLINVNGTPAAVVEKKHHRHYDLCVYGIIDRIASSQLLMQLRLACSTRACISKTCCIVSRCGY